MLGAVRDPRDVDLIGMEMTLEQVIMDRIPGLLGSGLAARDHRRNTHRVAQPPHALLGELISTICKLISNKPVTKLRILVMDLANLFADFLFLGLSV